MQWIPSEFPEGYWFIFAQGISPDALLDRLGADPIDPAVMGLQQANDYCFDEDSIIVRAGTAGGWSFAVVPGGVAGEFGVAEASKGTQAFQVYGTTNALRVFSHAENGEVTCQFISGWEGERTGVDPDRFLGGLIAVGLLLPDGRAPRDLGMDVQGAHNKMLEFASAQFSINLCLADIEIPLRARKLDY
ncbi:DUF6461 domain-containing protein [Streptomyces sp. NPDC001380]|uniref:DUF6461 domain-containing protein n=1 Tax=Streptomyces sp. NPDC001380 TaxID=3364566 RepID=UPI0036793128